MISRDQRLIVEAIRRSGVVTVTIPGERGYEDLQVKVKDSLFVHDVAIALQSYYNRSRKDER